MSIVSFVRQLFYLLKAQNMRKISLVSRFGKTSDQFTILEWGNIWEFKTVSHFIRVALSFNEHLKIKSNLLWYEKFLEFLNSG